MAVRTAPVDDIYATHPEKKVALYFMVLGFIALSIGVIFGPFQIFNYAGIDLYPALEPLFKSYYQGLTLHGVLNAIVFTQLFIQGSLLYLQARDSNLRPQMPVAWTAWWIALIGLALAAWPLLTNDATVLYTFYPPLQGHWAFYVGAALIIVSSLFSVYLSVEMWVRWKRQNPGKPTPLVTFMITATWMMWGLAAMGLVVETVFFLIPWSLGLIEGVDPLIARSLFWWSGHPIVYFWLLPAYVSWYGLLPKQAGGKLVSDSLARMAFLGFLAFSTPVGFHHQFADPGISAFWKGVHTVLTMMVAVPSLMTAFTIAASLELAGRSQGGKGALGWIRKLPWNNPSVVAQLLGAIAFIFGGAGGIVNASFTLDYVVHNTTWIPGHFHLPVATASTLTFFGIAFWLIPHITHKPLAAPRTALAGVWWWFTGMMFMAFGMHMMGLQGVPRRAHISAMNAAHDGIYASSAFYMVFNAVAGVLLTVAATMLFYVLFATLLSRRRLAPEQVPEIPFAEAIAGPVDKDGNVKSGVKVMDRLFFWWGFAVVLVLIVYMPTLVQLFMHMVPAPGMRLW
ncbi:b(o/a)3-type cytochrome-c oxidase subunit 1 [Oceanithermus sp.]|uniref:b(o/a)3-type cytochrome-c oxidase subunit 1 n=1 Tax=Oceanithermus sp. TaxID=2268145 RepID=UPI0025ED662F|nr:b(o/a)3-type cytochrome-c oxidase subunit 1 [Oceanithermus sp.]